MKQIFTVKTIRIIVWLVFIFGIGYLKLIYHELWKDEWQAWFVAKDKSLSEILSFLYYEGHPALWYLYLKFFTLFSGNISQVLLIQFAHLLTVAGGLHFLFFRLKLPLIICIIGALSYFFFFEYGIVNRGYFLMVLFSLWASFLMRSPDDHPRQLAYVLFLLCQTEVYGVFIAISLGILLISNRQKNIFENINSPAILGLLLGLIVFLISVFPRAEGHIAKTRGRELSFSDQILTSIQGNLSNTYLIGSTSDTFSYGWNLVGIILSILAMVGLIVIFKNNKRLLLSYSIFIGLMVSFSIFFFMGGVRQWGVGFIFLFILLGIRGLDLYKDKVETIIVIVFCLFGITHNFKAVKEDIRLPFTNAMEAGFFLKEKVPPKVPIVAINKFEATPVIGYAGRKFYELPEGVLFSYFRWVDRVYIPTESELRLFAQFKGVGGIVVISPKSLDVNRFPNVKLWQTFDRENYKKENYYVYTLAK